MACLAVEPEYAALAPFLRRSGGKLVRVDAGRHHEVASALEAPSLPHTVFYVNGKRFPFQGPHRSREMLAFAEKLRAPAVHMVASAADVEAALSPGSPTWAGYTMPSHYVTVGADAGHAPAREGHARRQPLLGARRSWASFAERAATGGKRQSGTNSWRPRGGYGTWCGPALQRLGDAVADTAPTPAAGRLLRGDQGPGPGGVRLVGGRRAGGAGSGGDPVRVLPLPPSSVASLTPQQTHSPGLVPSLCPALGRAVRRRRWAGQRRRSRTLDPAGEEGLRALPYADRHPHTPACPRSQKSVRLVDELDEATYPRYEALGLPMAILFLDMSAYDLPVLSAHRADSHLGEARGPPSHRRPVPVQAPGQLPRLHAGVAQRRLGRRCRAGCTRRPRPRGRCVLRRRAVQGQDSGSGHHGSVGGRGLARGGTPPL